MESKPNLNQMHHVMLNYRGGFRGKVPLGADLTRTLGCVDLPKRTKKEPKRTQKEPKSTQKEIITIL